MDDTITEFLRDTTERRETFTEGSIRLDQNTDAKVNINEKYIQTKLDKMCGQPSDAILYFSRQDLKDPEKKKRNDQTLGRYLEELSDTAKKKCNNCDAQKHQHS